MASPSNIGRARSPSSTGRDVQQHLVDQSGVEERAGQRGAGLELDFVDPAPGEQAQHRIQVEAALAHGHRGELRAGCRVAAWRRAHGCRAWARRPRARGRARRWPGPDRAPRAAAARTACRRPGARSAAGSSASTVPAPVTMAPERARQRCTSRREASPLIHLDSPLARALRPSRLVASFTRSHGRPRSHARQEAAVERARLRFHQARIATAMPAVRSLSKPAPSTCGNGSRIAATTRDTPAAIKRVRARAGATGVRARFQRYVRGRALRAIARGAQCEDFRMRLAGALVPAFADDSRRRARSRSRPSGWAWWCRRHVRPGAARAPSSRGRWR